MSEQETTDTKDTTAPAEASVNHSPDETFWQRVMREVRDFFTFDEMS